MSAEPQAPPSSSTDRTGIPSTAAMGSTNGHGPLTVRPLKPSPVLSPEHRAELHASGISDAVIDARGYYTERQKAGLEALGFSKAQALAPALVIPQFNVYGAVAGYQIKPKFPRTVRGRLNKYETPSGRAPVVDVPPPVLDWIGDPQRPLFITEGTKKADAGASQGLCVLSVPGVYGWRGTNKQGGRVALPDLEKIAFNGRPVYITFDSDVTVNRKVQTALSRLKELLESRSAEVMVVYLPPGPGLKKVGLDDFLAAGHTPQEVIALAEPDLRPVGGTAGTPREETFTLGDIGNAKRLVARHGPNLRYCPPWKAWLIWDKRRWKRDETGEIVRLAKETQRSIYIEAAQSASEGLRRDLARLALASEAESRIMSMISLAQSEPGIPILPDALDQARGILNFENGTLEMRTGVFRPHRREDLLTKLVPCEYNPTATCPTFDAFLARILDGNNDLIAYVQRLAGYTASGLEHEKLIAIPWGSGDNGKSTLLEALGELLGDYATPTAPETFLTKEKDVVRDDLARLKGARFVWTGENEKGRKFAAATIKQLTGRDTITARFHYEKLFSYKPEFTIWFSTNHKPVVPDTGDAIWDRFKLIPFTVRIPKEEQDKGLPAKLLREAPGILVWIVQGFKDWSREGLREPKAVTTATAGYRKEMDPLADFIAECCVEAPEAQVANPQLWQSYEKWCAENGEQRALYRKAFAEELQRRGFVLRIGKQDRRTTRIWMGIGLRDEAHDDPESRGSRHEEGGERPPPVTGVTSERGLSPILSLTPPRKKIGERPLSDVTPVTAPHCDHCDRDLTDGSGYPFGEVWVCYDSVRCAARGPTAAAPPPVPFTAVTDDAALPQVIEAIGAAATVGLDLETTGLNPRLDRVRLVSLAAGDAVFVIDAFRVNVAPLFPILREKRLVAHNAAFDLGFLHALGFEPGAVEDTMLLSQVLHAGERDEKGRRLAHKLAAVALRELGETVAKDEQKSDWLGDLTEEQLTYAARDAAILPTLHARLAASIREAGLEEAARIEARALPAIVWMASAGVSFERDAWAGLAAEAGAEAERLRSELDAAAPKPPGLDLGLGWRWDSPAIVLRVLREVGCEVSNTDDETLAGLDHPLAPLLQQYRAVMTLATSYGEKWLDADEDGRLYPGWRQIGAESGRMACREPNVQQLPRDSRYRACIAAPAGRVLVKADYSQIELRIAAKIADERRMLEAYRKGGDLHRLTASLLTGRALEEVSKEDRQLAKAVNFGLLFGMGAERFRDYAETQFGVTLNFEEAKQYRDAFFKAYPGLARWHRCVGREKAAEARTLSGRRRLLDENTPFTHRLNTPVQGTGADGLKRALALLWERRAACPGAVPVIACHDEIVVECDEGQVEEATAWLKQAMRDGMAPLIRPVPVEVEVSVGTSWGA